MEKKGFTLVELLVVIAIIALLMGILMPALARVRQIAYRLYCGTNLSGIGKAMLIYSNDYDDELPRAGLSGGSWVNTINWSGGGRTAVFPSGNATISSNFYLLVKYCEVTPKSFLCKGDVEVHEFNPSDHGSALMADEVWDFGPKGQEHCSYSYHTPFGSYGLTASSNPGMVIAGDPNPWLDTPGQPKRTDTDWNSFNPDGSKQIVKLGNSVTHQEDGQNILFVDGHTSFEKNSACGVDGDNVYTSNVGRTNRRKGNRPADPSVEPTIRDDSILLTDGQSG